MTSVSRRSKTQTLIQNLGLGVIVLGLILLLFMVFSEEGTGEQGAPPKNGATTETWIIEDGDNVVRENENLSLGGDVWVEEGGSLTFSNSTITFLKNESAESAKYTIECFSNSSLIIKNGSKIYAPWAGQIHTEINSRGTTCIIEDSEINDVYLGRFIGTINIKNNILKNLSRLFVSSSVCVIEDNYIQMKDNQSWNAIIYLPYCNDIVLNNNTIISDRTTGIASISGGTISNNVFSHEDGDDHSLHFSYSNNVSVHHNTFDSGFKYGLYFYKSKDSAAHHNTFKNMWHNGMQIYCLSNNFEIYDNTFGPMKYGVVVDVEVESCNIYNNQFNGTRIGVLVDYIALNCLVYNNDFVNSETAIKIDNESTCEVFDNSMVNSEKGVFINNNSYPIDIHNNLFTNITSAVYECNSVPTNEYNNIFIDVEYVVWRGNNFSLIIKGHDFKPLDVCNITIFDGHDTIIFESISDENGTISLEYLTNSTSTLEESNYYNPYHIVAEKWGYQKTMSFHLPEYGACAKAMKLNLLFDLDIWLQNYEVPFERGSEVPIEVTFENSGTMNFTSSQLRIEIFSNTDSLWINNITYLDVFVGNVYNVDLNWFIEKIIEPGSYFMKAEFMSFSQHLEFPHTAFKTVSLKIVNSPPVIDPGLMLDPDLTGSKNENLTIDISSYISDFEDDPQNLTINISDIHLFREVRISNEKKVLTLMPYDNTHGTHWVNITIMDMDGAEDELLVAVRWINHAPDFLDSIDYSWYLTTESYEMILSELVNDEDPGEEFSWEFVCEEFTNGNVELKLSEDQLQISRLVDHLTTAKVYLTVFDSSMENSTRLLTIHWVTDIFIANAEFDVIDDIFMENDTIEIIVRITNSHEVIAKGELQLFLDTKNDLLWNGSFYFEDLSTRVISLVWTAVPGAHELIVALATTSPLDRNLTGHEITLPIEVCFPLILNCEDNSAVTITKGAESCTMQLQVFSPSFTSIEDVEIRLRELTMNGEVCDLVSGDLNLKRQGKLSEGIDISVEPQSRTIVAASSEYYTITIMINGSADCAHNDLMELCIYAEGDDGRSNDVVLRVTVKVEEQERSANNFPLMLQSTVILLAGAFLVTTGTVKMSSILSNNYYPMYRLSRYFFYRLPRFSFLLCPLRTSLHEDDEVRYNEYRNKICEILELRGGQGATLNEIMEHLKRWFPYGTTGNANPEDNRITGVVRGHMEVLRRNNHVKQLGERYFFRSYQPTLPGDIYTSKINWNSLLHDKKYRLKGESICHIITSLCNNGNNGMKNKDLAEVLEMSPSRLFYHLKRLEKLNIVERRKGEGKRFFIEPNFLQFYAQT